jgi:hypothetical protein
VTSSATIAAEPTAEMRVFRAVMALPSESGIHFLVYCSLVLLTLLFVIAAPAIVLFFAEHRPVAGALFVTANLTVFCASFASHLRRYFDVPRPSWRDSLTKRFIRILRKVPATGGVVRGLTTRLAPAFVPFPDSSGTSAFFRFYSECWNAVCGQTAAAPRLYWSYQDRHANARVSGRSRDPVVAISAGLVSLFPRQPECLRVYLLHEFGHISNRDLEVFGLTMSGSRACKAVMLASSVLSTFFLLPFFTSEVGAR